MIILFAPCDEVRTLNPFHWIDHLFYHCDPRFSNVNSNVNLIITCDYKIYMKCRILILWHASNYYFAARRIFIKSRKSFEETLRKVRIVVSLPFLQYWRFQELRTQCAFFGVMSRAWWKPIKRRQKNILFQTCEIYFWKGGNTTKRNDIARLKITVIVMEGYEENYFYQLVKRAISK